MRWQHSVADEYRFRRPLCFIVIEFWLGHENRITNHHHGDRRQRDE
jgi:hypothetical protein